MKRRKIGEWNGDKAVEREGETLEWSRMEEVKSCDQGESMPSPACPVNMSLGEIFISFNLCFLNWIRIVQR